MADDSDTPNDSHDEPDKESKRKMDYEVGYGRPPKHRRFRKGQSGNPKGRRKGSRALKTDLDEALKAKLSITVGGKKRSGTTQALAMYALAVKAATGDLKGARLLADLVMTVFGPDDRRGGEAKLSKQDAELLERLFERFEPEGQGDSGEEVSGGDEPPQDGRPSDISGSEGETSDGE